MLEATSRHQMEHANACPRSIQTLVDEGDPTRSLRDAWGRPLALTCPGLHDRESADVASAGRDGRFGTADDIDSWDL